MSLAATRGRLKPKRRVILAVEAASEYVLSVGGPISMEWQYDDE